MKAYRENGGKGPHILTFAVDGGEYLASRFGHFINVERISGYDAGRTLEPV
jgi:hypothetical protein